MVFHSKVSISIGYTYIPCVGDWDHIHYSQGMKYEMHMRVYGQWYGCVWNGRDCELCRYTETKKETQLTAHSTYPTGHSPLRMPITDNGYK